MVPALKNIVMVIKTLIIPRPLNLLKIKGYAHIAVITSETIVQIKVRITVQINDLTYLAFPNTYSYEVRLNPLGKIDTSCLISASELLSDLAARFNIGTRQITATKIHMITNIQSPALVLFDLIILFSPQYHQNSQISFQ